MSRLQEIANKWKDCPICEAHVRHLVEWDNEIDKLKAENEKYRKALEFYASNNSYKSKHGGHIENKNFHSAIGRDCGKIARQALKENQND